MAFCSSLMRASLAGGVAPCVLARLSICPAPEMETCSVAAAPAGLTDGLATEPTTEPARREAAAEPLAAVEALDRGEFWMGIMVAFSPVGVLNVTLLPDFRASVTFLAIPAECPPYRPFIAPVRRAPAGRAADACLAARGRMPASPAPRSGR